MENKNVKKGYIRNVIALNTARVLIGKAVAKANNAELAYYKPKHTPFILIANHSDPLDPGFEMMALKRYIRFIASDHLMRSKIGGLILTKLGGVIVKHREKPSSVLNEEIIANIKAGIPVGIHAEGGTSTNGETGYISVHTGQLVKDSGAALITFRFTGGYLRTPRWAKNNRKGLLKGQVVNEYSPEFLKGKTAEEITQIIRRDTYINVYEEQKKETHLYKGADLAEYVERTLFMCPKCREVGRLHSKGDYLNCDCGYSVRMGEDGFFHENSGELVFDNILEWDKWQRSKWKEKVLKAEAEDEIFSEEGQIIGKVTGSDREIVSENGTIRLFGNRIELIWSENGKEEIKVLFFSKLKQVQTASREGLILITDSEYYDIRSRIPRAATKYVAAWRYRTGKDYL